MSKVYVITEHCPGRSDYCGVRAIKKTIKSLVSDLVERTNYSQKEVEAVVRKEKKRVKEQNLKGSLYFGNSRLSIEILENKYNDSDEKYTYYIVEEVEM